MADPALARDAPAGRILHPLAPRHVDALVRLADREQANGRCASAIPLYRLALELEPDNLAAAGHLTRALFCAERWDEAWPAFHDVRFRLMPDRPRVVGRDAQGRPRPIPFWNGGPPPPSLLVLCEQGLGDTIQFARFLPHLVDLGVAVTLAAPPRLHALLRTLGRPFAMAGLDGSLQGMEGWTNLLDLPHALRLPPQRYAADRPYLAPDPQRVARWRARVGEGRLVGLQWRGNPAAPVDAARSASLADFAPLAAASDLRFVCLQKDATPEEIAAAPFGDRLRFLGDDFDAGPDAFLDAAAVLACLERVVTVDTAMVHLAGALGCPADLLLQPAWADWRWLGRESDTVWYPGVRLRRRAVGEPWSAAVARVAADLARTEEAGQQPAPFGRLPLAPLTVGELVDRLGILALKAARIADPAKRANVAAERAALQETLERQALPADVIAPLVAELQAVNTALWDVEDALRACEARGAFDAKFIELARSVYRLNDRRAALKREISRRAGSALVEEKSYC